MQMRSRVLTHLRNLRQLGGVGAFWYYANRLAVTATEGRCRVAALSFYVLPVPRAPKGGPVKDSSISLGRIEPGAVAAADFGRPQEVIADRFKSGHLCIGARQSTALLGFMCLSLRLDEWVVQSSWYLGASVDHLYIGAISSLVETDVIVSKDSSERYVPQRQGRTHGLSEE